MRAFRRICVYCGSHDGTNPAYRSAAEAVGRLLASREIGVVFGGGHIGLMGALADAALAGGGEVIGVIPAALQQKELAHPRATAMHVVGSMHDRKQMMADLADAFLALPGGIGTLEELFETWTWLQLDYHAKPVGLLNVAGFYDSLLAFLDQITEQQFLRSEHRQCLVVEADPEALLTRLALFTAPKLERWWNVRPPGDLR